LRDEVPGCEALAFADLSTGLVLCASSGRKKPQEWFDQMCQAAIELLDGEFARRASGLIAGDGATGARQAIQIVDRELRLFLRSEAVPNEALCCICATDVSVDHLAERARALLREISTTEAPR
jgi:hypothetical protein